MSKREERRQRSGGWQNTPGHMTLEEAAGLGYDLNIEEPEPEPDFPENAIVPAEDGTFIYKRIQLKSTGIIVPDDLEREEWSDIFQVLRKLDEAIQWAVGDLVKHAESQWGETYTAMAEATGYSEKSLREYAYIARSVDLSIRMDNLSFGHHQLVAGFKDPQTKEPLVQEQRMWLERASENGWSIKALRQAIADERQQSKTRELDNWLFGKDRIPANPKQLQTLWSKARNGDMTAREEALKMVASMHAWLDEIIETIDDY